MIVIFWYFFTANQVSQPATKFDDLKQKNPEAFKPFTPTEDCGEYKKTWNTLCLSARS